MKSIIRLIIIILLAALTSESFAQTFGIKAGVNFSNMQIKESELFIPYSTSVADPKLKVGFNIGGVIEYPVLNLFSLESGLSLTTLGTKLTTEEPFGATTLVTKANHSLYYLNVPLNIKVPFSIKGFDFYGSVGGYAGLGLIGTADTISTFGDLEETTNGKIAWGSEQGTDYLKRLDYGVTLGTGIEYASFRLGIIYNLGLANISSDSEIGTVAKNRGLGISVGYIFGGSEKTEPEKHKAVKVREEKVKENPVKDKEKAVAVEKTKNQPKVSVGGKKAAAIEAERGRLEKIRTDSIAAVAAEQERIRIEKVRADSIEAAKAEEERLLQEKAKADSLAAAQKAAQNTVVYRVQFASNASAKGSYPVTISGKSYKTWEYSYSGAYRSTVGEFKTLAEATAFQKLVRQSGYPQAFVVAFKNNIRATDPALFK
jgi:hypothetical protein